MAGEDPAPQPVVVLPGEAGGWLHRIRVNPDGTREGLVSWVETVPGYRGGLREQGPRWLAMDQVRLIDGVVYSALEQNAEQVDGLSPGPRLPRSVPDGWPPQVPAPGEAGWEKSAVAFLLECLPADYRAHEVVRNPRVLTWMARCHIDQALIGLRAGYRKAAVELKPHLPPHALAEVLATYQKEAERLKTVAVSIQVVSRLLR